MGAARRITAALLGLALSAWSGASPPSVLDEFDADERARLLGHGPWPPPPAPDPSNRFSGLDAARRLGERLFADPRLSINRAVSCASCHDASRAFTDGRPKARAIGELDRNTQGLFDVDQQRWFGWDGGADSLWAATLRPMLDPRELGTNAAHVAALVRGDPGLRESLAGLRAARPAPTRPAGAPSEDADESVLVDVAKVIAVYQASLRSPRTPFDDFRDAVERGDAAAAARYPAPARRGLKLFLGRGQCGACHVGPSFSNGEFHDIGIGFMPRPGVVDPGRHAGLKRLAGDRYNLLGPFNDEPPGPDPQGRRMDLKTRTVQSLHRHFGEWRTPGLRSLALTAPYMHDGRLARLEDVVAHYDKLDEERLHTDGEALLRPLRLDDRERADLLAFLRSLSP